MLRCYAVKDQTDWDVYISGIVYAYNTSINPSLKTTPFEMMHGREPIFELDRKYGNDKMKEAYNIHKFNIINETREFVKEHLKESQAKNKVYFDNRHRDFQFKEGDFVLVERKIPSPGLKQKLIPERIGPFKILSRMTPVTYIIEDKRDKPGRELITLSHVSKMVPYYMRRKKIQPGITYYPVINPYMPREDSRLSEKEEDEQQDIMSADTTAVEEMSDPTDSRESSGKTSNTSLKNRTDQTQAHPNQEEDEESKMLFYNPEIDYTGEEMIDGMQRDLNVQRFLRNLVVAKFRPHKEQIENRLVPLENGGNMLAFTYYGMLSDKHNSQGELITLTTRYPRLLEIEIVDDKGMKHKFPFPFYQRDPTISLRLPLLTNHEPQRLEDCIIRLATEDTIHEVNQQGKIKSLLERLGSSFTRNKTTEDTAQKQIPVPDPSSLSTPTSPTTLTSTPIRKPTTPNVRSSTSEIRTPEPTATSTVVPPKPKKQPLEVRKLLESQKDFLNPPRSNARTGNVRTTAPGRVTATGRMARKTTRDLNYEESEEDDERDVETPS